MASFADSYMSGIKTNKGRSKELDAAIDTVQKACDSVDNAMDKVAQAKADVRKATAEYVKVVNRTKF